MTRTSVRDMKKPATSPEQRDRAYCEDFVREMIKRTRGKLYMPTLEMINGLVDKLLATVPKPPRKAR